MRALVLLGVLATACDQGATAAPAPRTETRLVEVAAPLRPVTRFEIRNDDEFQTQALKLLDEMLGLFVDASKDCDLVAARVETWGAQNATRIGVLTAYSNAHPEATQKLSAAVQTRMTELMNRMMPTFSECASNQRLMQAFSKLDPNQQQRPR